MQAEYIADSNSLIHFCQHIEKSPWLALDTEFIRERTYFSKLCLIQIATPDALACIDPLAEHDQQAYLKPLLALLYDSARTKVLHAAHQDLEIFYFMQDSVFSPVFDTQLAATVLGQGDQVAYAALVQELLGVQLDKSQVRTDWSKRPLSPEQLDYAADDVRYLCAVYQHQLEDLQHRGRLNWLAEDFARLSDSVQYRIDYQTIWQRIRGHGKLKPQQLIVLQQLAAWREEMAVQKNKPRRWICDDQVLLDLARAQPATLEDLNWHRGVNKKFCQKYGTKVLEIIKTARQLPKNQWPRLASPKPLSAEQDMLVDALLAVLKYCAQEQQLSYLSLANRKDIERWLQGEDIALMQGWRYALAGQWLQNFMQGELSLRMNPETQALIVAKKPDSAAPEG